MNRSLFWILLACALSGGFSPESAIAVQNGVTVSSLFSDHMVLQRNTQVEIWGIAEAGKQLETVFAGVTTQTVAGPDGKWTAQIRTPEAGGPFELQIRLKGSEPQVSFSDVMVGDVWLCSGQSNMEWAVKDSADADKEIEAAARFSAVRLCTIERNASIAALEDPARVVGWNVCSPESIPDFSAVAYAFAKQFNETTGVPVGLVNASWGGTTCEAWTEFAHIRQCTELAGLASHYEAQEPAADPAYPGSLYNGMIAPLTRFRFAGVLWYQGEANVGRGNQYRFLFPCMIDNWRKRFADGESLPFYFVQLAPYRYSNQTPQALPELWDAQLHAFRNVRNTGMVVTTDIAERADIHPKNKQEVGRRLTRWAIANSKLPLVGSAVEPIVPKNPDSPSSDQSTGSRQGPKNQSDVDGSDAAAQYRTSGQKRANPLPDDQELTPSGPLFRSHELVDSSIVIEFDYSECGLESRGDGRLLEFTICGEDREFIPAEARIEDHRVVVSSPKIRNPVAVRFAWTDTAEPNLFNKAGLPASPFRTDDFPLTSENVNY